MKPGWSNKEQLLQERFLALAEAVKETPDALRSDRYEEGAGPLLKEMLDGFGFTPDQASRLIGLIHWPLMNEEQAAASLQKNDVDEETE